MVSADMLIMDAPGGVPNAARVLILVHVGGSFLVKFHFWSVD